MSITVRSNQLTKSNVSLQEQDEDGSVNFSLKIINLLITCIRAKIGGQKGGKHHQPSTGTILKETKWIHITTGRVFVNKWLQQILHSNLQTTKYLKPSVQTTTFFELYWSKSAIELHPQLVCSLKPVFQFRYYHTKNKEYN